MDHPTHELEAYFANDATDGQFATLEAWINADPANARAFMQQIHFRELVGERVCEQRSDSRAVLAELARYEAAQEADLVTIIDLNEQPPKQHDLILVASDSLSAASEKLRNTVAPKRLAFVGLAAAVVLGLTIYLTSPSGNTPTPTDPADIVQTPEAIEPSRPIVATLTASHDAQWADRDSSRGSELRANDHLTLTAGFAEITMNAGAVVIFEAPATFEMLDNNNALRLHAGKLLGRCRTADSRGFTVLTKHAQIVDLGTEFGVEVDVDAQTQVHVYQGSVTVAAQAEGEVVGRRVVLLQRQAAKIEAETLSVARVAYDDARFERRLVKRLDLVDIVAGGDGTQGNRDIGIDATSGRHLAGLPDLAEAYSRVGDGRFYSADGAAFIAGVFVPGVSPASIRLPGGVDLPALPATNGATYGLIWCGGSIPADSTAPLANISTVIDGTDYASYGHQVISLHTNSALVIDLEAIREAYPGYEITRVTAAVDNTCSGAMLGTLDWALRSEFHALLDATVALSQPIEVSATRRTDPIHLDLELGDARYLTLAATDGGDGDGKDWIVLGDPMIELRPID